MNKTLRVKCPQCETEFSYYESEFRPFCTERCKQIDLGHWFQESYVVPVKENVLDVERKENANEYEVDLDDEENNESEYN